ncbi:hypothetical protein V8D89_009322 [Ganoderma adspersum]
MTSVHSPLCGILVYVAPKTVVVAMCQYAIIFATTTCALAVRSYIHIFRGLRNTSPPGVISLGVVLMFLMWYTLAAAFWVVPLASGIHLQMGELRDSATPKSRSASGLDKREASRTPELITWANRGLANRDSSGRLSCGGGLFMAVTIGRLEIMKSPPTRIAVMFFVEPDGIGTAVSVFVSDLVVCMLLQIRTRPLRTRGSARTTNPAWREHKGTARTRSQRLWDLVRWSIVVATLLGTFWASVIVATYRHEIWTNLRNDAPMWAFWNFTLFVAIASSLRMPALVWLLPQSFVHSSPYASDGGALSNDPEGTLDPLMMDDAEHEHEGHIELQECGGDGDDGRPYNVKTKTQRESQYQR